LVRQPVSRTNDASSTATFDVDVGGTAPLGLQWYKDGVALSDGGNISGPATPRLELSNVLAADAGGYFLVATNVSGSVTSRVAILTVIDPVIHVGPVGLARNLGESAELGVMASGTAPLSYRWFKGGAVISEATGANLSLTNLLPEDAGDYQVVISNTYGSVTSQVAWLTINLATVDPVFHPSAGGYSYQDVKAFSIQPDGEILVGGGST